MNKTISGGIAVAFAVITFQSWQATQSDNNTLPSPIPIQQLQAGAAPNNVSGAGGLTPVNATNLTGCQPQGGWGSLGNPTYTFSNDAHIDTDGGTQYNDQTGSGQTSSGQNSDTYPGVVLTRTMYDEGIRMGDLVQVTNNQTGQAITARIYDSNFDSQNTAYRDQAEISDYAASELGIQMQSNGNTIGTNPVTIQAYAGTANDQLNCSNTQSSTN